MEGPTGPGSTPKPPTTEAAPPMTPRATPKAFPDESRGQGGGGGTVSAGQKGCWLGKAFGRTAILWLLASSRVAAKPDPTTHPLEVG